MNLNNYQREAQKTDRVPGRKNAQAGVDLVVPLLGLAGETGELLSEYKKHLRDGSAHLLFKDRVAEELGDLLWYVANVAAKFDLKLEDIAQGNLKKTKDRWGNQDTSSIAFDAKELSVNYFCNFARSLRGRLLIRSESCGAIV